MNAAAAHPVHRPWWPWVRRAVVVLFLCGVAVLVVRQARTIDWREVLDAIQELPLATVLAGGRRARRRHARDRT